MGGTSTDLSLYAGELPRRYLTRDRRRAAAGTDDGHPYDRGRRRLDRALRRWPAAGRAGIRRRGSRARLLPTRRTGDDHRLQPRARADPAGTGSRASSGRAASDPLDVEASRRRLAAIAASVATATDEPLSIEALAADFVDVAVARMSYAVRELALRQGHDPTPFALLCFGGAAGQHACAVAEALGCREIVLPALAGVLSAWGIGACASHAASGGAASRPTLEAWLRGRRGGRVRGARATGERGAGAAGCRAPMRSSCAARAQLRLAGSDSALEVALGAAATRCARSSRVLPAHVRVPRGEPGAHRRRDLGGSGERGPRPTDAATFGAAPSRGVAPDGPRLGRRPVAGACRCSRAARSDAGARDRGPGAASPRTAPRAGSRLAGPGSIAGDGNLVLRQRSAREARPRARGPRRPTRRGSR